MHIQEHYKALKYFIKPPPKIEDKSPEELTSRAEKAILETASAKSDDSILKGKDATSVTDTKGMDCTVRTLYKDRKGLWTERYPYYVNDSAENDTTSRFALVVRNKKSQDSRKKFEIESLIVQSPYLKRALGVVFAGYPGLTTDLDRLEFTAPFQPFVHRWHQFEQATVNEKHIETKQHLALLWNVLEAELKDLLQKMKDYERHGIIDYGSIWTIFEPNCLVLTDRDNSERLYRCVKGTPNPEKGYSLEVQWVDWDGSRFGTVTGHLVLSSFSGTKALKKLAAMPLARHADKASIEQRLLTRGKTFESLKGYHFKYYDGLGLQELGVCTSRYNIQSRIIIDTAAYNLFNPDAQVKVHRLKSQSSKNALQDTDLLITKNTLRAYSLKDKKWLSVFIPHLTPITYSTQSFTSLVLPPATKSLIHAFATAQTKSLSFSSSTDMIQGKGRGTVVLLSGPPGVGKTLTAESVAEAMQVPLYMLSAGDLGTEPEEVERVLTRTLELCTKWRAILLLDEADVFLLSRNAQDLERNKLVSIFLRVLEYHAGFLFLTTNRIEDIDAAFESRIHLSLLYRDLDTEARIQVWTTFLRGVEREHGWFTVDDIAGLAGTSMNGRLIKNCVRSAQLLAASQGDHVGMKHVEAVMKVREENSLAVLREAEGKKLL